MYNIDDINTSNKIFYYLIQSGELSEEKEKDLFRMYSESEQVMNLVKIQGENCNCKVEKYSGVIYLIPSEENDFLGYSKGALKKELCKSNCNDKDYYLSQFVILTMLVEFYGSQGRTSKSRDFLKGGELLNIISNRLKESVEKENLEEEQIKTGIAYTNILERFEALKSSDKQTTSRTTKEGFIYTILNFLENQGLINYVQADDMIITTSKLDNFMDWNILNKNNYQRVVKAFGGEINE
ncbi:DUF6063 family protein [Clostridium tagluense]|uniref:DUF6063 family protein n=1 Tax=Clostridium tagluense TaxID=360422 RepID=UPI001CF324F4|nr:DUF6063 family protein [Clostridium tagluense]MCB2312237.1 DUF6063 family protein [Clostridium tagluense]MCB2316824.1 DUF6063 family protein [Clostridium tagluense]MCB2321685.1 DUF6063 family protein [Clostridium tagluense]MCB2326693.1 DUF6063 family protein [Clostridium tagluense]MCB2331416.1 DUF6063 family protein [Clostridium tagluense]